MSYGMNDSVCSGGSGLYFCARNGCTLDLGRVIMPASGFFLGEEHTNVSYSASMKFSLKQTWVNTGPPSSAKEEDSHSSSIKVMREIIEGNTRWQYYSRTPFHVH